MFETSLVASQPHRGRPRHRQLLPVAALAHGVLVGGVLLTATWSVDALPEPDLAGKTAFVVFGPPPPLGDSGPSRPPRRPPAAEEKPPPQRPVQPTTLPADTPAAPEVAEETPTELGDLADGDDSGDAREGSILGVPGGPGVHPVGDIAGTVDGRPIHIHRGMTPPEVITRVIPAYTEPARRARLEGTVILEAIIDTEGRVTAVRVLRSLPLGLEQSAVEAVRQWRFRPARLNGQPRNVYFTLTVNFELQ